MSAADDEPNSDGVAPPTALYPPAEITPDEFEALVAEYLASASANVAGLQVNRGEIVPGIDGEYEIDATVRFQVGELNLLVLVEAKRYTNPIKREVVQVLHQKVQSTGAHKGVLISTSPFQRGALRFALTHGIALATVTEGRFTFETRTAYPTTALSRDRARELYALPTFVMHSYVPAREPGTLSVHLVQTGDDVAETFLGIPIAGH